VITVKRPQPVLHFRYTPEVFGFALHYGGVSTVDTMVQKAAIYSGPEGNRRYHGFVFKVVDGLVVSMVVTNAGGSVLRSPAPVVPKIPVYVQRAPAPAQRPQTAALTMPGPNEFLVYDECETCYGEAYDLDGKACTTCDGKGDIRRIKKLTNRSK
jgi:hypothetical protein